MDTLDTYAAEALQRTEEVWEAIAKREIEDINYLIEDAIEFGRTYVSFSVSTYNIRKLIRSHYEDRGYVVTSLRINNTFSLSWAKEDPKSTTTDIQCIPDNSEFLTLFDKAVYIGLFATGVTLVSACFCILVQVFFSPW